MELLAHLFSFKPASRKSFVAFAIAAMQRAGWSDIAYDAESFSLTASDGQVAGLSNLFIRYSETPWGHRRKMLDDFFVALADAKIPETYEQASDSVVVMLRHRSEPYRINTANNTINSFFLGQPQFETLDLAIMYDRPNSVGRIPKDWLNSVDITFEELLQKAKHNLRIRSNEAFREVAQGVYESAWQDSFDATRMIFADIIAQIPVHGRHVVMVPDRDHLIVTGDQDLSGLTFMVQRALANYDLNAYRLTTQPFVLDGGNWQHYKFASEDDAFETRLRIEQMRVSDYEAQRPLLNEVFGADTFVASYMLYANREIREIHSSSAWTEGVDLLLPRSNIIHFIRGNDVIASVSWHEAETILGPFLQVPEIWPPRYFLNHFPIDVLQQMQKV